MNGFLRLDGSQLKQLEQRLSTEIHCFFQAFDRQADRDDEISYSAEIRLIADKAVRPDDNSVKVYCKSSGKNNGDDARLVYENYHAHPQLAIVRKQNEERRRPPFAKPDDENLSVLLMGIDSVSLSMFKRLMPATADYLASQMQMFFFTSMYLFNITEWGKICAFKVVCECLEFNKVGDNSYPNLMPLLTGKIAESGQPKDLPSELPTTLGKTMDDLPFIWKQFEAQKNYAIGINEEVPIMDLFHYKRAGFRRKPVPFYYHSYWSQVCSK